MNTDEAYPDFNQLTESFVKNPLHPSHPTTFSECYRIHVWQVLIVN